MPSPLHVPIATISTIKPHSNADSLDVAEVLGWQCVVSRGQFKENDACIYFPPDTVLPREVSDRFGVTQYLDRGRIKATRLRGEPSFGLVMPIDILPDDAPRYLGESVAEYFGATKWEPPTREAAQRGQGKTYDFPNALPGDSRFAQYTHIANLRHYPDLFASDELVVVTEKLHGTNSRVGIIEGERMAGSHRVRRGQGDALYWSPWSQPGVEAMLTALAKHHKQVVLYGEILGSDVQSLDYGYKGHEGYRAFDLMIDGRYVDYASFVQLCGYYGVAMVPGIVYVLFNFNEIKTLAQGRTELNADHLREGVVVKPLIERHDRRVGRAIAKFVSDDYLLAKHSDFAEV